MNDRYLLLPAKTPYDRQAVGRWRAEAIGLMQEHERRLDQTAFESLNEIVGQRIATTRIALRRPLQNVRVVEERIFAAEVREPCLELLVVVPPVRGTRRMRPVATENLTAMHHARHSPYAAIRKFNQSRRRDVIGMVERGDDRHQRPQVPTRRHVCSPSRIAGLI